MITGFLKNREKIVNFLPGGPIICFLPAVAAVGPCVSVRLGRGKGPRSGGEAGGQGPTLFGDGWIFALMPRPLTAMGRRARSCPPWLWPPVQSGRLRSLARSLWQKRRPRSGAEAVCSAGPRVSVGCLQRPLRAEHFPQRAPAGRPFLGRNSHPFFHGFAKERDCRRGRGCRVAGRVRPHRCRGKRPPFAGKWCMAGRRPCRRGEGGRSTPFCLFTVAIPGRSEMAAALIGRSPPSPPLPGGEKGGPFGRGLLAGRRRGVCGGRSALRPPGAAPQKGGRLPLPSG